MKSVLKTLVLSGLLGCATFAMADNMTMQTAPGQMAEVQVSIITQAQKAPQIQLQLGAPSEVIFAQGSKVLLQKHYPAGTSMIDTSSFPAGHYQITVAVKQQGASFVMMQNVVIAKSDSNS